MGVEQIGISINKASYGLCCKNKIVLINTEAQKHKQKSQLKSFDTNLGLCIIIKSRSPILLISNIVKAAINATITI